jgi:hypothetical protein
MMPMTCRWSTRFVNHMQIRWQDENQLRYEPPLNHTGLEFV